MDEKFGDDFLPAVQQTGRLLTQEEFQQLNEIPALFEWLAATSLPLLPIRYCLSAIAFPLLASAGDSSRWHCTVAVLHTPRGLSGSEGCTAFGDGVIVAARPLMSTATCGGIVREVCLEFLCTISFGRAVGAHPSPKSTSRKKSMCHAASNIASWPVRAPPPAA